MNGFKGFTLAEILVIIALLLIIMVLGLGIFVSNNRFYENQTGKIALVNAFREAADRLAEYGREAINFETTYIYGGTTYTSGPATVIFRLPGKDVSGNILSGVYDYAIVTMGQADPARLELIVDADPASARPERNLLLTGRLTNLAFTYDNVSIASAGRLTFEISGTAWGRNPATEKIYGQVTLRN